MHPWAPLPARMPPGRRPGRAGPLLAQLCYTGLDFEPAPSRPGFEERGLSEVELDRLFEQAREGVAIGEEIP